MSQNRESWFVPCSFVAIIIIVISLIISPLLAIITIVLSSLILGVLYLTRNLRTRSQVDVNTQSEPETKQDPATPINSQSVQVKILDPQPDSPQSTPLMKKPVEHSKAQEKLSSEELQSRIVVLEERVRSLRQQLQELPSIETETSIMQAEKSDEQVLEENKEYSERAIEQLIETLDEKLAKGAISQQLYQSLHDRYLARLKKAKCRHHSSTKRGSK